MLWTKNVFDAKKGLKIEMMNIVGLYLMEISASNIIFTSGIPIPPTGAKTKMSKIFFSKVAKWWFFANLRLYRRHCRKSCLYLHSPCPCGHFGPIPVSIGPFLQKL